MFDEHYSELRMREHTLLITTIINNGHRSSGVPDQKSNWQAISPKGCQVEDEWVLVLHIFLQGLDLGLGGGTHFLKNDQTSQFHASSALSQPGEMGPNKWAAITPSSETLILSLRRRSAVEKRNMKFFMLAY